MSAVVDARANGLRFRMTPKGLFGMWKSLCQHPSHPWLLRTTCSDGLATTCPGLMGRLWVKKTSSGWSKTSSKIIQYTDIIDSILQLLMPEKHVFFKIYMFSHLIPTWYPHHFTSHLYLEARQEDTWFAAINRFLATRHRDDVSKAAQFSNPAEGALGRWETHSAEECWRESWGPTATTFLSAWNSSWCVPSLKHLCLVALTACHVMSRRHPEAREPGPQHMTCRDHVGYSCCQAFSVSLGRGVTCCHLGCQLLDSLSRPKWYQIRFPLFLLKFSAASWCFFSWWYVGAGTKAPISTEHLWEATCSAIDGVWWPSDSSSLGVQVLIKKVWHKINCDDHWVMSLCCCMANRGRPRQTKTMHMW